MSAFTEEQLQTLDKDIVITLFLNQQEQLNSLSKQIESLTEQIKLLNQRKFGRKSEVSDTPGQMHLSDFCSEIFNEAEANASDDFKEPEITEITVQSHKRKKKKGSRDQKLEDLPARIIEHRLSDEELHEKFPHGYKELPVVVYKRLNVIPQTFIVDEHHVHVYASRDNDGTILKAKRPADVFRDSIVTPELLALIMSGKYDKALPLERQAKTFQNEGVNLETNTLSNWMIQGANQHLSLVYNALNSEMNNAHVLHVDESPCQVVNDGKGTGSKSYMWVYRTNPTRGVHPIILFDYQTGRSSSFPEEFLKNYSKVVVTDGYEAYHTLSRKRTDLTFAGCWVHAKRGFSEIVKSIGNEAAQGTIALEAQDRISELFHIDNKFDGLPAAERKSQRQQVLKPIVDDFFAWVKEKLTLISTTGATAKALNYCVNQEQYLREFLNDGCIPMDNNLAEQAIRPFILGRKNWVTINSIKGAKASAIIYSIVETAKANNLIPYEYLLLLFREIPKHRGEDDLSYIQDLLPWSDKVQKICRTHKKV